MRRVLVCPLVYGADLFIYPKACQSSAQQHRDEGECKAWGTVSVLLRSEPAPTYRVDG